MATALDVVNEWAADSEKKQDIVKTRSGLLLRWLNQGQLRYAEKAECLRSVWTPTITSSGNIALPTDFIYEFADRVKRDTSMVTDYFLKKIDFQIANARAWSGLTAYSIFNGTLYVWAPGAATPSIPYCRKPTVLTTLSSDSLEIPTEFHSALVEYMDLRWDRDMAGGNYSTYSAMLKDWDMTARSQGTVWKLRNDRVPVLRSNFF